MPNWLILFQSLRRQSGHFWTWRIRCQHEKGAETPVNIYMNFISPNTAAQYTTLFGKRWIRLKYI